MSYTVNPQRAYIYVPSGTGFNTTIPDGTTLFIIKPSGALTSGTVVLPPNPSDGMPVTIESTKAITLLTVSPNTSVNAQLWRLPSLR